MKTLGTTYWGSILGGKVTKIELHELLSDKCFHLRSLTYP